MSASYIDRRGRPLTWQRCFTSEAAAQAYIAAGDPLAPDPYTVDAPPPLRGRRFPELEPADPAAVRWETTLCDPAVEPWIFAPGNPTHEPFGPGEEPRLSAFRKVIQNYYAGICDSVLAWSWGGRKEEGPLTPRMRGRIRRGNWLGIQMYKDDRVLYHLDDGSDNYIVATAVELHHLFELGVRPEQLRPLRPGQSACLRAGPEWRGG